MKRNRLFCDLLVFCAFGLSLAGCDIPSLTTPIGRDIKFGAQTSSSRIATKTVYTGELVDGGDAHTGKIERIGWESGDLIRVVSQQAESPGSADYSLTPSTTNGKFHYADAAPTSGDGHGLQWGTGEHIFYAMYPAPATTGAQAGLGVAIDGNGYGVVSLSLPDDQSFATTRPSKSEIGQSHVYYGDMRLAYMTAATKGTPSGSPVLLSFTPMVTTFYVTVKNTTGSAMNLKRVALSSESDALCGSFTATLRNVTAIDESYSTEPDEVNYTCVLALPDFNSSTNATIYSDFGSGLSLAASDSVVVALFALPRLRPQYISGLTLSVTSDETGEVRLPLKKNGDWIHFTGCNKHNINNIAVPDVEYVLERDKATLEYDYTGLGTTAQQFTVTSKKVFAGGEYQQPADWKTQIYVASSDSWVDLEGNCPDWLENFPLDQTGRTTADGSISDAAALYHTYQKDVTAQPVTSHVDKLKSNKVYDENGDEFDNSAKGNAIDLSKYNFITRRKELLRTTANTYIVAAPGWYKIPMVYGNLIEKGSTVGVACKGSGWHLGHLDYFKKAPSDENIYLGVNYPWLRSDYLDHCRVYWEAYSNYDGTSPTPIVAAKISDQSPAPSGIIKNVEMNSSEEFIYFEVDEDAVKPGNFLMATFNDDDDCCWSWHIWITDQNMKLVDFGDNSVLPVNLGWIDDTEGQYYDERSRMLKFVSTEKAGLESETMTVIQPYFERASTSGWQTYYQWGRKDPLTDVSYGITAVQNDDRAINGSIKHPTHIQYDESTYGTDKYYDWTSANYNNLWDSQNNDWATASSSLPDHKTVYDPSPRGFSVPPDNAWDDLGDYQNPEYANGVMFYTSSSKTDSLFFPSLGYLNFTNAQLTGAGDGYYWTIRPGESLQRRASFSLRFRKSGSSVTMVPKQFGASSPFTTPAFRACAYAVRPVLYDVSAGGSEDIEGAQLQEFIFDNTNMGNSSISDLNGLGYTVGDVTVSFSRRYGGLANQHPSYDASTGIVTLPDSGGDVDDYTTKMTVSVPASANIIRIILYFDSSDTGGATITAVSSPENGGGYSDGKGSVGRNGIWEISNYSAGVFTPNANSVTFKTAATGADRLLTGMSVIYK